MRVISSQKLAAVMQKARLSSEKLVQRYAAVVTQVSPTRVPRIAPDPDDDVVLGTALAASADFIVTGDEALLSVGAYQGIRIVTVRDALQIIAR